MRRTGAKVIGGLAVAAVLVVMAIVFTASFAGGSASPAAAQTAPTQTSPSQTAPGKSPFGITPPSAQGSPKQAGKTGADAGLIDRVTGWVQDKQAEYNRGLVQAVRRFKTDNVFAAAGALALLSFLYGVFHAVGPGHGKAIISSYVLGNAQTARRGVLIAFLSSGFQALSAIVIVGIMALIFRATSLQMQAAETMIERVSYALVALVGGWLLFTQARALLTGKAAHSHGHSHGHGHGHGHAHGAHGHDHATHHAHLHKHSDGPDPAHAHARTAGTAAAGASALPHTHAAGEACDHQHLPGPEQLEQGWSWRRALALSFAVGIRPCTGAVLVLVFALTQGLFWAGVFATFAMALGTAITVSALAVLAVASREWAARMSGGDGVWMNRVYTGAALGGSALVFLMGLLLLWGSFGPARPF